MLKKIILPVFILVALIQVSIPVKMILEQEHLLVFGSEFKFKTAPVDPNDPFRGKYISLRFKENRVSVFNENEWKKGDDVYLSIDEDQQGFARIVYASKTVPEDKYEYIKAKVQWVSLNKQTNELKSPELIIEYPFNRFYMEESKAKPAEILYRKLQRDSSKTTYALVNINDGKATLKDVMIDGVSSRELVGK